MNKSLTKMETDRQFVLYIYIQNHFKLRSILGQKKTSIQWTPGSQIYRSNQKITFGKNDLKMIIKKHKNYA